MHNAISGEISTGGTGLAHFALRLRADARFMAALLDHYARRHGCTFEELSDRLACPEAGLTRLAMCLKPRGAHGPSREEVRELAGFCRIDEARLSQLLREAFACECGAGEGVS